jgi:hypothetical protein
VLSEVYGKSEGNIFKTKYRPAGMLLDVNALMSFRSNCNCNLNIVKIAAI